MSILTVIMNISAYSVNSGRGAAGFTKVFMELQSLYSSLEREYHMGLCDRLEGD